MKFPAFALLIFFFQFYYYFAFSCSSKLYSYAKKPSKNGEIP